MKRTKQLGLVGLIGLITVAAVNAKRMGIYLGLLQSDLDANGFAITNAVTFRGSNFVYEPSGVAILNDATNNDLRLGLSATNEALLIGARATNNDTVTSNGVFAAAQAMTNAHGLHVDASNILSGGLITSAALTGRTMTNLSVKGNPSIAVQDDPGGKEVDIVYDTGIGANAGVILDSTSDPFDVAIKLNGTGIVAKAFSGNLNASQLASGTIPYGRLTGALGPLSTNNAAALTNLPESGVSGLVSDLAGKASVAELADATNHTVPAALFPALTGDVTTPGGSLATTLKNTGTAGTYTKTTFDAQGRETSGTTLSAGDIPAIAESGVTSLVSDLAGKVSTAELASATNNLNASALTVGTVPEARSAHTLTNVILKGDGGAFTAISAPNGDDVFFEAFDAVGGNPALRINSSANPFGADVFLSSTGMVASAFSGNLNASQLASGTVAPARLGSGSGGSTKFLREDSTFQTIAAGSQTPWTSDINGGGFKLTNVAGASVTSLTNSGLTASRVTLTDANKAAASAAASGSVPLDADGSAATFAQVSALAPGYVVTNNNANALVLSNGVKIDIAHTLSLSNTTASTLLKSAEDKTVASGDLTGDVTTSGGLTTTLATGNAGNLNSGTLLAARMPALTGDITTSGGAVATTLAANTRISFHTANTGNILIPASTTIFIPLQNCTSNCTAFTSDVSGGTRSVVPFTTRFKNMYVVSSVNPGTSKCTITLMTNGVAGSVTCGPSGGTTANDTTHSDTIVAGTEVGWKIVIASAATSAKYTIGVESDF